MCMCVYSFFFLSYWCRSTVQLKFLFSSKNQEKFEHDDVPVCSELHLSPYVILLCFELE